MCGPPAILLAVAAAAVTAGGQIYGGMAQNAQAKYEAKVDERNAKLAAESGHDAQARGEQEQMRLWRQTSQRMGAQRAQYAAAGLDVNFGTPADVQDDTLKIGSEDVLTSADNTRKAVRGFDIEGSNYTARATAARMKGKAAMVGGIVSGVGTLLGAASQVGKMSAGAGGGGGGGATNFSGIY